MSDTQYQSTLFDGTSSSAGAVDHPSSSTSTAAAGGGAAASSAAAQAFMSHTAARVNGGASPTPVSASSNALAASSSSSSFSAAASTNYHARKHSTKSKRTILNPQAVAHCRLGYTRLVSVRAFAASYRTFHSQLEQTLSSLDAESSKPDLSVDDIVLPTPFQAIEKAIDEEVGKVHAFQEAADAALKVAEQEKFYRSRALVLEQARESASKQQQQHAAAAAVAQQQAQEQTQMLLQQQFIAGTLPLIVPMMVQQQQQQQMLQAQQQQQEQEQQRQHDENIQQQIPQLSQMDEAATHEQGRNIEEAQGLSEKKDNEDMQHENSVSSSAMPPQQSTSAADSSNEMHDTLPDPGDHPQQINMQDDLPSNVPAAVTDSAEAAAATSSSSIPNSILPPAIADLFLAPSEKPLPPDFGSSIPNYENLTNPLVPLQKLRQQAIRKRKLNTNCVTTKTFQFDVASRVGNQAPIPVSADEVVLSVAVYHSTNFQRTQEFLVLGSQPLTALRDRIYCLQDHTFDGPSTPSSYFFIEGKFYNDLRDSRAIKLSSSIIEWVREESRFNNPGLARFDEMDMDRTCFMDLSIRLGSHYLFQHQGDCCHTIIFTQMRMINAGDVQNALAYPLKPFQTFTRRKKCRVCDLYPAAYVTYGDKLADENPFFYCEECYRPLHYSAEGKLLYSDFQVYSYEHE